MPDTGPPFYFAASNLREGLFFMATKLYNEWTGHAQNMEYTEKDDDVGLPVLRFELGGKDFTASGADARALASLCGTGATIITIRNDGGNDEFCNNEDHHFIEGLEEVSYLVFETHLGS